MDDTTIIGIDLANGPDKTVVVVSGQLPPGAIEQIARAFGVAQEAVALQVAVAAEHFSRLTAPVLPPDLFRMNWDEPVEATFALDPKPPRRTAHKLPCRRPRCQTCLDEMAARRRQRAASRGERIS